MAIYLELVCDGFAIFTLLIADILIESLLGVILVFLSKNLPLL